MKIRLLPMSKMEFAHVSDVMYFLTDTLKERGGKYYYRRKSINRTEDILIAFQYGGKIVASAVMIDSIDDPIVDNGVDYNGCYVFDMKTMKECVPAIDAEALSNVYPEFRGFNQSTQYIPENCEKLIRV